MKFKRKRHYKSGDTRDRTFFAWLPYTIFEGKEKITVWLEQVEIREKYFTGYSTDEWELVEVLDYESKSREQKS